MCGFAGFIDFSNSSSLQDLKNMCDVIAHRGPDADSYFFQKTEKYSIGLGHRRLSIIDLHAEANQPMEYKNWIIIFNGEIYNYKEIKKELCLLGHDFKTESDTEVILHAFEEWGDNSVHRFIGMFAFLIYDSSTHIIKTFRDRPGVKPLHIYQVKDTIMWASEIKSFHEHPLFSKIIRNESVKSFIKLGYIPSPHSIFENVTKQQPGTIHTYQLIQKNENKQVYWDVSAFYEKPIIKIEYPEAKENMKNLLTSACNYRMVSDVPVGIFLSGGYDSSLVASILQSSSTEKIKTFTIGVDDPKINEAKFAKEIANRLGTEHTEVFITENEMTNLIEDLPFYYDEPFGDSSAIPTMLVSKIASKSVTVALSADGGDEVFGGYNRYDHIEKLKKIRLLSKFPFSVNLAKMGINDSFTRERLINLMQTPTALTLAEQLNNPYQQKELDSLFKQPFNELPSFFSGVKIENDLRKMMAYDYQTYLLNDILVKVDRATMRYSIEGREPLLDHRLIEYAALLPNEYKIKKGDKKYMLKDIVHDFLPKEIMERPKMGFAAPVEKWLKIDLKEKIEFYFSKSFIDSQNIFNPIEIQKIHSEFMNGKSKYGIRIWYILMFQMWYERWMLTK